MYPFIELFGKNFQTYWIMVGIGIISGTSVSICETKRKNENVIKFSIIAFFTILFGLLAAHISSYIFWNIEYIKRYPLEMLRFWSGGLTLHGGLIGGILTGIIFSYITKFPTWKLADITAPAIPLGQFLGRIGCFLNSCCYGSSTQLPWGVTFTRSDSIAPTMIKLHPTQLYESIGCLIIFIIIWKLRKKIQYNGGLFLHYLIMYSVLRIITSSFRGDSHNIYIGEINIRTVYIVCLLTIGISIILINYLKYRTIKKGTL